MRILSAITLSLLALGLTACDIPATQQKGVANLLDHKFPAAHHVRFSMDLGHGGFFSSLPTTDASSCYLEQVPAVSHKVAESKDIQFDSTNEIIALGDVHLVAHTERVGLNRVWIVDELTMPDEITPAIVEREINRCIAAIEKANQKPKRIYSAAELAAQQWAATAKGNK